MLDSPRPGAVLRSGRAVLAFVPRELLEVDWLSGCSMSYRTSVFDELRFDAGLSGYSMGEDLDFSFRAGRVGKLVVTPEARLEHRASPVNRLGVADWYAMDVVTRHRRVLRSEGRLSRAAFWWSVGGEVVLAVAKAVVRRRRSALAAVRGTGRGVAAVLRTRLEDQLP
jgi:GT2 family glycosyltransferase